MRTVTISRNETTVTISQVDEMDVAGAEEVAEMLHDAMIGAGYHPENVADAMVEVGNNYSPKEAK